MQPYVIWNPEVVSAFENSVVGENSKIGERSGIRPDIKIWPGKHGRTEGWRSSPISCGAPGQESSFSATEG
jgi:NDP-sugar pyrophosphorylase family protein